MNKATLIEKLSEKTGLNKKQVEVLLDAFQETTIEALNANDDVTLTGFGTFSSRIRTARMGVDPCNPKEKIEIPEVKVPKFKAGKALKDALKA